MAVKCLVCGAEFESDSVVCVKCNTPHHEDCFNSTGCSIYGCGSTEYYSPKLIDGNVVGIEKKKARLNSLVAKDNLETIVYGINTSSNITTYDNDASKLIDGFIQLYRNANLLNLDFDKAIIYSFENMHIVNDAVRQPLWNIAKEIDNEWKQCLEKEMFENSCIGMVCGYGIGSMISMFIDSYTCLNLLEYLMGIGTIIGGVIGSNFDLIIGYKSRVFKNLNLDNLKEKWIPKLEQVLKKQNPHKIYVEPKTDLPLLPSNIKN